VEWAVDTEEAGTATEETVIVTEETVIVTEETVIATGETVTVTGETVIVTEAVATTWSSNGNKHLTAFGDCDVEYSSTLGYS
jgi:hypothetical protein